MVKFIAPESAGSGIPVIEIALSYNQKMNWRRILPAKILGSILSISSKMVLGREGPAIQIGGSLGEMLSEWLGFDESRRHVLISAGTAAGAAAGLAATFNTPLAGVLFVLEEMRGKLKFSFVNFKTIAICCVVSTLILRLLIGSGLVINMTIYDLPSIRSLWLFLILGVIVGYVGLCFNNGLMKILYLLSLVIRLTLY